MLPSAGWAMLILVMISWPASQMPDAEIMKLPHFDKIIHFSLFFVFAVLLAAGLFFQPKNLFIFKFRIAIALAAGLVYGSLTEIFQSLALPERHGSLADFAANAFGTVFGVLCFRYIFAQRLPG
jgi:VanZ family protein